jgi:hypothetical protein
MQWNFPLKKISEFLLNLVFSGFISLFLFENFMFLYEFFDQVNVHPYLRLTTY